MPYFIIDNIPLLVILKQHINFEGCCKKRVFMRFSIRLLKNGL
jgi:hypothetical protein